jgi:phosphatidylglycerol:prolipoprotein diacylglycerol transferase
MYEAVLPFPHINPVLLHIWGPLAIRWYALAYISGLLLGWWWILQMLRQASLWTNPPFNGRPPATADEIGDLFVWVTMGVILGGRIGWVLIYGIVLCSVTPGGGFCAGGPPDHIGLPMDFLYHPIRIIAAWDGGMSFHGAAIGVILSIFLFARRHKLSFLMIGDLVCAVQPIGQFFGRIANFINGELWGKPTDVPWAMVFPHAPDQLPRHPSQLYEAGLEGIVLFVILQVGIRVFRWHERPGLVSGVFLVLYAVMRYFVEFFREPDAPFLAGVSMGQALSILFLIGGAAVLWIALRAPKAQAAA